MWETSHQKIQTNRCFNSSRPCAVVHRCCRNGPFTDGTRSSPLRPANQFSNSRRTLASLDARPRRHDVRRRCGAKAERCVARTDETPNRKTKTASNHYRGVFKWYAGWFSGCPKTLGPEANPKRGLVWLRSTMSRPVRNILRVNGGLLCQVLRWVVCTPRKSISQRLEVKKCR